MFRLFGVVALAFVPALYSQAVQKPAPDESKLHASSAKEIPARASHAMVVSVHHDAADAGVEILRKGGNAVDAAVATGFALAVVHPSAGNIGGGGFLLMRLANGESHFLDFRETAPAAASAGMYLDKSGNVIPDASIIGYRAIGVPGSVAGLVTAQKKWGKLSLREDMVPAIRLASKGFALSAEESKELGEKNLALFPETHRTFQRNGDYFKAGEVFKQPDLARTLERIAANPDDFYHGAIARELAAAIQKGGGLITEKDLAAYQPKERTPLTGSYRGYQILAAPPPSSGGTALLEALNILEGYDLARLGDRAPAEMHLILEAYRRAYLDRNEYLGDPDFVKAPIAAIIDKKYATAWRSTIPPESATPNLRRPAGFLPPPPTSPAASHHETSDTTHFSVLDAQGNAVAVTTTLNGSFGSFVTAGGLGFLLNDNMDNFATKPGAPNMYGLIQGPANEIAPGKRPLSSMTPTIVLQDGKVRMVLGSPGGPRIITTVANIFVSVVDGRLNIQEAVDAPRFHLQHLPDKVYLEPGFPSETVERLKALGYSTAQEEPWSNGECIYVNPKTGELEGGQDHRQSYGKAAGY
jgi:gamma-glutamyltranspeptidase / glutathione hydrolase